MKRLLLITAMVLFSTGVIAQEDSELLNDASKAAMDNASGHLVEQLEGSEGLREVKRIGIASVENDQDKMVEHLKSMLTDAKFDFDIVLINDVEWGPLLDEFQRQQMRDDLIIKDTANELRIQGVDAVLWGSVDAFDVTDVEDGADTGRQATVRVQLTLASTMENNPGSVLWSYEAKGIIDTLEITTNTKIEQAVTNNSYLFIGGGVLLVLFIGFFGLRSLTTPR